MAAVFDNLNSGVRLVGYGGEQEIEPAALEKLIGRNKLFSIINIGGLTLGLAVAMLILIFVRGELDYDDWVADGEQIARLESIWPIAGREALNFSKSTPPSSVALKEYFPNEIESITRIRYLEVDLVKDDQVFTEHVNFVSRDFLKIFNLTSVSGNLQSMFSNNLSAIIGRKDNNCIVFNSKVF